MEPDHGNRKPQATGNDAEVDARAHSADEREILADSREAALDEREFRIAAREADIDSSADAAEILLEEADKRDSLADARDTVADNREEVASLDSFLRADLEHDAAHKARRSSAWTDCTPNLTGRRQRWTDRSSARTIVSQRSRMAKAAKRVGRRRLMGGAVVSSG